MDRGDEKWIRRRLPCIQHIKKTTELINFGSPTICRIQSRLVTLRTDLTICLPLSLTHLIDIGLHQNVTKRNIVETSGQLNEKRNQCIEEPMGMRNCRWLKVSTNNGIQMIQFVSRDSRLTIESDKTLHQEYR